MLKSRVDFKQLFAICSETQAAMTNNSLYIKNDRSCFMKVTLTTCPTSDTGKQIITPSRLQEQKKKKEESCQAVCIVILSVKRAANNALLDLDINQGAGILLK